MIIIFSDVHGNFEALKQVFKDVKSNYRGSTLYCLGDILGYGPKPVECLRLVRDSCKIVLQGNHDWGALFETANWNMEALLAIECHRSLVEKQRDGKDLWRFIANLPKHVIFRQPGVCLVHGSPLDPLHEYIVPSLVKYTLGQARLWKMADAFQRLCFVGHSHLPAIYCFSETGGVTVKEQRDLGDAVYDLDPTQKYIINVGSVGQPRDRDPRACYCVFDEVRYRVSFRRVEYDIDSVCRSINSTYGLIPNAGERLRNGE